MIARKATSARKRRNQTHEASRAFGNRGRAGVALLLAAFMAPAWAAEERVEWDGSDEVTLSYPDRDEYAAAPFMVVLYENSRLQTSQSGRQTIDTRFGPLTLHVRITGGPEIMTVVDWPSGMIPYPPEIAVDDGDSGRIEFLPPLM